MISSLVHRITKGLKKNHELLDYLCNSKLLNKVLEKNKDMMITFQLFSNNDGDE